RRHRRPAGRAAHRSGHAAAVARAHDVAGRSPAGVADADAAAAPGRQSARGVSEAVRPGRHGQGTLRDSPRNRQHSGSRQIEADGTTPDPPTLPFGSNMGSSAKHNEDPLPPAVLGHAHGKIKGAQHVKYPQDSRFADLLVTLFDRNSIPVEKLGDSGGILSEV